MKFTPDKSLIFVLLLFNLLNSLSAQTSLMDKVLLGREEMVLVIPVDDSFKARIDTGAETSSLHATAVVPYIQNGQNWVQFNINHDGKDRVVKCPLESMVAVRQVNSTKAVYRPLVRLPIQIGSLRKDAFFTLTDRSRMTFPVLVGRNILMGDALVDVSLIYQQGR